MFDRMVVQEAIKRSWALDNNPGWSHAFPVDSLTGETSLLIYNIFGGEILKTREKNGWHFYNRINGERIDFSKSELNKSAEDSQFEDLPSNPDEANQYFEEEDYSSFFTKFVSTYEEAVGLNK